MIYSNLDFTKPASDMTTDSHPHTEIKKNKHSHISHDKVHKHNCSLHPKKTNKISEMVDLINFPIIKLNLLNLDTKTVCNENMLLLITNFKDGQTFWLEGLLDIRISNSRQIQ